MNIFHVLSIEAWEAAVAAGSYRPDSLGTEGFIHFSYAAQVAAMTNRYYRELDQLQVIEVDPGLVGGELRVEPSPATGEFFPHLYGPLPIDAVVSIHPLNRDDTGDYVLEQ
jgi:uncharacterized protein (DUF952 family)